MKNGTYKVTFMVELNGCGSKEEAEQAVMEMVSEAIDNEGFPEVEFEMVEEFDMEYETEEDELEELNF